MECSGSLSSKAFSFLHQRSSCNNNPEELGKGAEKLALLRCDNDPVAAADYLREKSLQDVTVSKRRNSGLISMSSNYFRYLCSADVVGGCRLGKFRLVHMICFVPRRYLREYTIPLLQVRPPFWPSLPEAPAIILLFFPSKARWTLKHEWKKLMEERKRDLLAGLPVGEHPIYNILYDQCYKVLGEQQHS